MAAALTNITSAIHTQCTDIVFIDSTPVSHQMKEVWYTNDSNISTKIWEKASSATWIGPIATNSTPAIEFTPLTNVSVVSFDMICDNNSKVGYGYGIYRKYLYNGKYYGIPVPGACSWGEAGTDVLTGATYLSKIMYTHRKTYTAGSYPALVGGNTYVFTVGAHYTAGRSFLCGTKQANSATNPNTYTYSDWSLEGPAYINGSITGTTELINQNASAYLRVVTA